MSHSDWLRSDEFDVQVRFLKSLLSEGRDPIPDGDYNKKARLIVSQLALKRGFVWNSHPDMEDWTAANGDSSNSSFYYLECVKTVEKILRDFVHILRQGTFVPERILRMLTIKHGIVPAQGDVE